MKTKLFQQRIDVNGNPRFGADLKTLLSLSENTLQACLSALPELMSSSTSAQEKQMLEALLASVPEPGAGVAAGLRFLEFLARENYLASDPPKDDPVDLADDLFSAKLLDDGQRQQFAAILDQVAKQVVPRVKPVLAKRRAATGVGPSFAGFGTTVEARLVQESRWSSSQPVDAYEPKVDGVVGVVSVLLRTDNDETFFFQADREEVQLLINGLGAALKDLDALEKQVR